MKLDYIIEKTLEKLIPAVDVRLYYPQLFKKLWSWNTLYKSLWVTTRVIT